MHDETKRFGARFWALAVCLLAGTVGCFGVAARAQSAATDSTTIVSVTDALGQLERKPTIRVGVMTERLRRGEMTDRVRPEADLLIATESQ